MLLSLLARCHAWTLKFEIPRWSREAPAAKLGTDKGGLAEPSPYDQHRTAVGFEEEVHTPKVLQQVIELEAEEPIWLNPRR